MRKWIILCSSCLLALFYPCAELLCWDTAGSRIGSWSEISCDGNSYSGTWTGKVTSDCRFFGKNAWEPVTGEINPFTKILTASGRSLEGCGMIKMTGIFSSDLVSVSGQYIYSEGGGGSFSGTFCPKMEY